jgi:hypothetical protein
MPRHVHQQTFRVFADHDLARTVTQANGRSYTHTCPLPAFEAVAWVFTERSTEGHNMTTLLRDLGLPSTQVNVALEFLKDRGCVLSCNRLNYAVGASVYEDALTEFWALAGT